jgi:hypothetical protein
MAPGVLEVGPPWARKRYPFTDIVAVQILQDVRKGMVACQVNIVLENSCRFFLAACKDHEVAKNTAKAISDMVQAPMVEQIAASAK